jgi:hypothetical protein
MVSPGFQFDVQAFHWGQLQGPHRL